MYSKRRIKPNSIAKSLFLRGVPTWSKFYVPHEQCTTIAPIKIAQRTVVCSTMRFHSDFQRTPKETPNLKSAVMKHVRLGRPAITDYFGQFRRGQIPRLERKTVKMFCIIWLCITAPKRTNNAKESHP